MKLLFILLSFVTISAQAASNDFCFPFKENTEGFNKVCVSFENPNVVDTNATIEVYKNQKISHTLKAKRVYSPVRTSCAGKEHECRKVNSSLSISTPSSNDNGIEMDIRLWQQEPNKCRYGVFTIKDRPVYFAQLYLECPRAWWETISF